MGNTLRHLKAIEYYGKPIFYGIVYYHEYEILFFNLYVPVLIDVNNNNKKNSILISQSPCWEVLYSILYVMMFSCKRRGLYTRIWG